MELLLCLFMQTKVSVSENKFPIWIDMNQNSDKTFFNKVDFFVFVFVSPFY